jgi:uncharacterized membrane protein
MENRKVGYLIIGMAAVIGVIVLLFNNALRTIVTATCSHGPACSMYGNIRTQTIISMVLVGAILIIGLVLIFSKEKERIIVKTKKIRDEFAEKVNKEKEKNLKLLDSDEKKVYQIISDANGAIFQSELAEKSSFDKVKVTRILDRIEGKRLIERKRRGMTNVVVLK